MILFTTRNLPISAILLSFAIVTTSPAHADNDSKIQLAIQTNYDLITAAFVRRDIKGATALFTSDYLNVSPEGKKQPLAEFREHYNNLFTRFKVKLTSNQATIVTMDSNVNGIDVAMEQKTEGTIFGFNKIVINQTSRDSWVKTPQGWRLK